METGTGRIVLPSLGKALDSSPVIKALQSSLDTPAMVMAVVLLTLLGVALYGTVLGLERAFVVHDVRLQ